MVNLGDVLRQAFRRADEAWINMMGRPVLHVKSRTNLRGVYVLPLERGISVFDTPDEMAVELGYHSTIDALKKLPEIGDILFISNSNWKVVQRAIKDNPYIGETRLILMCSMYMETKAPADPLYHEDIHESTCICI
jgi:hypothetical protein